MCITGPGISNAKDFFTMHRLLAKVTIILNSNQLQSDFTERTTFSIGSGSVKVYKYSHYSVQFPFALCDFEKNTVQVWLRFDKTSIKSVYKTTIWVRLPDLKSCFAVLVWAM